jgi:hypothetical protein
MAPYSAEGSRTAVVVQDYSRGAGPLFRREVEEGYSARVPLGTRVEIKLEPSSIHAEPMEIVETREEDLRPMLVRQDPIVLPPQYVWGLRAAEIKGVYRVCVGKDGKVSLVTPLVPSSSADPYVMQSIARGWEYRALSQPACFNWRVTLHLDARRNALSPAPPTSEQSVPPGSPFRPR